MKDEYYAFVRRVWFGEEIINEITSNLRIIGFAGGDC